MMSKIIGIIFLVGVIIYIFANPNPYPLVKRPPTPIPPKPIRSESGEILLPPSLMGTKKQQEERRASLREAIKSMPKMSQLEFARKSSESLAIPIGASINAIIQHKLTNIFIASPVDFTLIRNDLTGTSNSSAGIVTQCQSKVNEGLTIDVLRYIFKENEAPSLTSAMNYLMTYYDDTYGKSVITRDSTSTKVSRCEALRNEYQSPPDKPFMHIHMMTIKSCDIIYSISIFSTNVRDCQNSMHYIHTVTVGYRPDTSILQ